jgi:acyl phosphate:glycerol-3-phosphate acyltransferase
MEPWINWSLAILGTFLVGGIPFGYIAGRMRGLDLRKEGSGNIGATNAIRVLGKAWGIPVFMLDVLKAMVPVLVLKHLGETSPHLFPFNEQVVSITAAAAAVLGHNFCPYLGFKGGKGMATSAGVLLALMPWSCLVCVATWVALFYGTRYVSVASIGAAVILPVATWFIYPDKLGYQILAAVLGLLAVWRHRSNLVRLKNGTENRFVKKSTNPS